MPLRSTDLILSDRKATSSMVTRRLDNPSSNDINFGVQLVAWCDVAGVDPVLALIQWLLETADATSIRWTRDLNSSGIGIVSGGTQQPFKIPNVDLSARLHVQCLYSLATRSRHLGIDLWPEADEWMSNVWLPKVESPYMPDVDTVADLGLRYKENFQPRATWSYEDGKVPMDTYGKKLVARGQEYYPDAPDQVKGTTPMPETITFGNVPHPPFVDRLIPDSQNMAWDNLGPREPEGVCQHSMIGSLMGTDGWFRPGTSVKRALTDYGIGGSTDGTLDGVIFRWNDPRGLPHTVMYNAVSQLSEAKRRVSANRSGWSNGGSDGLEGDGPNFVRKMGVAGINRNLVSIERSDGGNQSTPMSAKQFEAICALTAHWFDYAQVPWDKFPLNPQHGIVTHMLHLEFATKNCPFPPVTSRINEIQNRVRAILKAGQINVDGPPIEPPDPVEPDKSWPNGWTTDALSKQFGALDRHNPDGTVDKMKFDEDGVISNSWVARAAELGIVTVTDIPKPLVWHRIEDTDRLRIDNITFDGKGTDNWCLFRPAAEVSWRWIPIA